MKQVFCTKSTGSASATLAYYGAVTNSPSFVATEVGDRHPWSVAGTFRNLCHWAVNAPGAAGSGKKYDFALMVDGAASALTTTILETATTARDVANDVAVSPGQYLSQRATPANTPTGFGALWTAIEFESDDDTQGYAVGAEYSSNSSTVYQGLISVYGPWNATRGLVEDVITVAGTISRLDVLQSAAAGVGDSYTYTIYVNGVAQDGTGGTPDTRVTISGASDVAGYSTFSLSVAVGDIVCIESVPSGSPSLRLAGHSIAFAPTSPGEAMWCGGSPTNPSTSATRYQYAGFFGTAAWSTTDNLLLNVGPTPFSLSKMRVAVSAAPGATEEWAFSLRQNTGDPAGGPSVVVAEGETAGYDGTGSTNFADGDTLSLKSVPTNTPTSARICWGFVQGLPVAGGSSIFDQHYRRMRGAS